MVATAILVILAGMAVPMAQIAVKREREHELRYDSWMIRDAIDRYKAAADRARSRPRWGAKIILPISTRWSPAWMSAGKKLKFLRKIPVDPMTKEEWGLRSMQDDQGLDFLGRAERFRCLHQVGPDRLGWHEI